jgi:hypothetical protein
VRTFPATEYEVTPLNVAELTTVAFDDWFSAIGRGQMLPWRGRAACKFA